MYDIAIETTWLPNGEAGITLAPSGVAALAPTTVAWAAARLRRLRRGDRRLRCLDRLELAGPLLGLERHDLSLDRVEQLLPFAQPVGDRLALGATLGEEPRRVGMLARERAGMALDGALERDHLADHLPVDGRKPVRVVEAAHQVGQVRGAEDQVERRRLGRGVQGDDTLGDHRAAAAEVLAGDRELAPVHLLLEGHLSESEVRKVDLLVCLPETLVELKHLVVDLLRLGLLRVDR